MQSYPALDNTIKLPHLRTTPGTETKGSNKIPYLRTENVKNHTLFRGTYLYSPYMGVPPGTISMRAWLVILTAWTLAFLLTVFLLHLTNSSLAQNVFICLYGLLLVVTICSFNINIWRKFQQKTVPHYHQNRALQNQRLTKALLFVSVFTLSSWIPVAVTNFISIFGFHMSTNILLLNSFISIFPIRLSTQ